jgi:hypothetical protein
MADILSFRGRKSRLEHDAAASALGLMLAGGDPEVRAGGRERPVHDGEHEPAKDLGIPRSDEGAGAGRQLQLGAFERGLKSEALEEAREVGGRGDGTDGEPSELVADRGDSLRAREGAQEYRREQFRERAIVSGRKDAAFGQFESQVRAPAAGVGARFFQEDAGRLERRDVVSGGVKVHVGRLGDILQRRRSPLREMPDDS